MSYLLDMAIPGTGHLALKRPISGSILLILWSLCIAGCFVALSFQVWSVLAFPLLHLSVAAVSVLHQWKYVKRRPAPSKLRPLPVIASLLLGLALFAACGWVTTRTLVRPVIIRSGSMTPSVVTGDVILIQLFAPILRELRLGDIVLVLHPETNRPLIKRILGMAGDVITIRSGELHRNGRKLSQCTLRTVRDHETGQNVVERLEVLEHRPYLVWDIPALRSLALSVQVQQGQLFVVGDNRDRSGDSRNFGTVPVSSVRGIVTTRIAPVLTNEVFQAPLGARRAAFERCSSRARGSQPAARETRKRR